METNEATIGRLAAPIVGQQIDPASGYQRRLFVAFFGVSPFIAACLWNRLVDTHHLPVGAFQHHLLWMLMFLKCYTCEDVAAAVVGATRKTCRIWIWKMAEAVAVLDVVRFVLVSRSVNLVCCTALTHLCIFHNAV